MNAICPGTVDSPSLHERWKATGDFEAAKKAFIARQPIGRIARPEEVADLARLSRRRHLHDRARSTSSTAAGRPEAMKITGLRDPRSALPDLGVARRLGRHEPGPRLFGRLCHPRAPTAPLEGHGLTFTIGRGNEVVLRGDPGPAPGRVVGLDLDWIRENPGRFWRHVTGDSQLRWIGPDKGAMHLATGAVVNAVWDLLAKQAGKPVWQLVADMSPEQLVAIIDFRYLTDCVTPDEALAIFRSAEAGKAERIATLEAEGYPCYTTSAGWLGYSNEKLTPAGAGGGRRRLQPHQDEGRPRPRRRHPAPCDRPRDHGPGPLPDDRRQPGVGGRPGHRLGARAQAVSTPTSSRSRPAPTTSTATARSARRWRR